MLMYIHIYIYIYIYTFILVRSRQSGRRMEILWQATWGKSEIKSSEYTILYYTIPNLYYNILIL